MLAKLPGILVDDRDAVVAQTKLLHRIQAVQPSFRHDRNVVVVQLPGPMKRNVNKHDNSIFKTGDLQLVQRRQPEEGTVEQLADLVALDPQHGQRSEAIESEPFDRSQPVAIQLPVKVNKRSACISHCCCLATTYKVRSADSRLNSSLGIVATRLRFNFKSTSAVRL